MTLFGAEESSHSYFLDLKMPVCCFLFCFFFISWSSSVLISQLVTLGLQIVCESNSCKYPCFQCHSTHTSVLHCASHYLLYSKLVMIFGIFYSSRFSVEFFTCALSTIKSTKSLFCLHRCAETTFLWVLFFTAFRVHCLCFTDSRIWKDLTIFLFECYLYVFSTYLCFCWLHCNQININSAFLCHVTGTGLPHSPWDNSWYFWVYEASTRSKSFLIYGGRC